MLKRISIIGFLIIFLISLSVLNAKNPKLKITKPKNNEKIYQRKISVDGISEGLDAGTVITIYVRTNNVYEQGQTKIRENGKWSFYPAVIGADEDRNFYADIFAKTKSGIPSNIVTVYRVR